jgi:hypothetical protein
LKRLVEILAEVFNGNDLKLLESKRLKALAQFRKVEKRANGKWKLTDDEDDEIDDKKIFPDLRPIIEEFEEMIQWKRVDEKRVPEPVPG